MFNGIFIASVIFTLLQVQTLYLGEKGFWKVYFDDSRKVKVIEIKGIKYGNHDILTDKKVVEGNREVLAASKVGKLYRLNGELFYSNCDLKLDIKLCDVKANSKIDRDRYKIFQVQAFNRSSFLKDSLNLKDYKFDWNVQNDFTQYLKESNADFLYETRILELYKKRNSSK